MYLAVPDALPMLDIEIIFAAPELKKVQPF
jgi:hypothetical protein